MPKVGGDNIDECMEICMSDPKLKEEEPDDEKRRDMCYAACSNEFSEDPLTEDSIRELINKYKIKKIK